jgi:hypothetical protein
VSGVYHLRLSEVPNADREVREVYFRVIKEWRIFARPKAMVP